MRNALFFLSILFCITNVFSQEIQFGDNIENNSFGYETDLHISVTDEFYLGIISKQVGKVKVYKKNGSTWNSIDISGSNLEQDGINISIESSVTGDSLFIIYTKSDGIYGVVYDGLTFSTPFYHAGSIPSSSSISNGIRTILNTNNGLAYCLISMDSQFKFLEFDPNTGFTLLSDPLTPTYLHGRRIDLCFDKTSGFSYFALTRNGNPEIILYNGTNWAPYIANVSGQAGGIYTGVNLDVDPIQNRLYVNLSFFAIANVYYRFCYVNLTNHTITVLQESGATTTNPVVSSGLFNDITGDVVLSKEGSLGANDYDILYVDGSNSGTAVDGATMDRYSELQHDSNGNIYWAVDDVNLKVYKLEKFNAGLNSIENNGINVFPNPVQESLNIKWTEKVNVKNIVLYNASGQLVWQGSFDSNTNSLVINVEDFPSGMYYLKFGDLVKKIEKL